MPTVISEGKGSMNNCPRTYLNKNVKELLTPNHLIYGRSSTSAN